mmetsp:Transcript_40398/g.87194  ORF Transcript_40398/g.87194 Transcript_40398/m.87194 type:complete len:207 (+) Transcript_40398:908-1528(+)
MRGVMAPASVTTTCCSGCSVTKARSAKTARRRSSTEPARRCSSRIGMSLTPSEDGKPPPKCWRFMTEGGNGGDVWVAAATPRPPGEPEPEPEPELEPEVLQDLCPGQTPRWWWWWYWQRAAMAVARHASKMTATTTRPREKQSGGPNAANVPVFRGDNSECSQHSERGGSASGLPWQTGWEVEQEEGVAPSLPPPPPPAPTAPMLR